MFEIVPESHLDHGLTFAHQVYLTNHFRGRDAFFIETIELPPFLADVPCALHGPALGDAPVRDDECSQEVRGDRKGASRVCSRAPRMVRQVTVIAGPYLDHACVLFTAYGGPLAPKEPWDAAPHEIERSKAFWAEHALSRQS